MSAPSPGAPEPALAFAGVVDRHPPEIEVRVNFGLFAGREASSAEIDRLAGTLLERVARVTIISETRREIDRHSEASTHQVLIAADAIAASERDELEQWLVERAEDWARACVAERSDDTVRPG